MGNLTKGKGNLTISKASLTNSKGDLTLVGRIWIAIIKDYKTSIRRNSKIDTKP